MTITAAQWKEISARLKRQWVHMEFSLKGHSITIQRTRKTESTTVLAVYIDNTISGKWMKLIDEIDPADEFMNQVVKQVWFHRFKAMYSGKQLAAMEKFKRGIGVKRFKEMYGDDPKSEGITFLRPMFGSAAVLVRQFKKIEGLTLVTDLLED